MWKIVLYTIICFFMVFTINAEEITVESKSGNNKSVLNIPVKIDNPEYTVGAVLSIEFSKNIDMSVTTNFFDIIKKKLTYSGNNKIYKIAAAKSYPDNRTNILFQLKTELSDKRSSTESDIIIKPILLKNSEYGWNDEYHDVLIGYKNNEFVTLISYENYNQKIINGSVSFINPCTPEDEPNIRKFVANEYTIYKGDSITLSWNVENVDKVGMTDGGIFGLGTFQPNSSRTFSPSRNTDYYLNAQNECGKDTKVVSIIVKEKEPDSESPPEIEYFRSNKNNIEYGNNVELSWNVSNANNITITDLGQVNNTNSVIVSPKIEKTYRIIAKNECGTSENSITIQVYCSIPDIIEFTANRISNNKFLLKWSVKNSDITEISKLGNVNNIGTKEITIDDTEIYEIIAKRICGENENIITDSIELVACDKPEIEYFRSNKMIVQGSGNITLSWNVKNADKVDLKGYGSVDNTGQKIININNTKEFHLRTSNSCGFDEYKITVEVKELNLPGGSCFINLISK